MSRDITNAFRTAVISDYVRPFLLFQAFFDTETVRFWNGVGDLTYDGDVYSGAGNLLSLDTIRETSKVESRGVTFTLSGVPSSMLSVALNENYQRRKIAVDVGFFDASGAVIADPYRFFSGKADVMTIIEGRDTCTIGLTAENELIALQRTNERRRTDEDQKTHSSNDTFFSRVAALQNRNIVWGKG